MDSSDSGSPVLKKRKISQDHPDVLPSLTPGILVWTSPKRAEIDYDWDIEDINILLNTSGIATKSRVFSSKPSLANMCLQAKSDGQSLSVSLEITSKENCKIWASDCLYSINSLAQVSLGIPLTFSAADCHLVADHISSSERLHISVPVQSIPSGPIRIRLNGTITSTIYQQNSQHIPGITAQYRLKRMKSIFKEEQYWDTEIKVGDRTFRVHKVILASASEVFHKMFESDMQEKNSGIVEISDVDPAVISDLLTYIYTGDAPNLKTLVKELMIAADKYNLQDLICICMKQLETNLTSSNVAEILLLADKIIIGSPLKTACINYVVSNYASVSQTKSWKFLKDASKELTLEIIESHPAYCTTSFCKKEISFRWVINDAKTLYQAKAKVQGPKIETNIFPYPLYCYLDFTQGSIMFQLAGDGQDVELLSGNHENVWASNCSFTILNMQTNQPLCTAKCEGKKLLKKPIVQYYGRAIGYTSYNNYTCDPVKSLEIDKKIDSYLQDQSLTVQVVAAIFNDKEFRQSSARTGSGSPNPTPYNQMKLIFESNSFSDAVIKVQKETFNVHKVVLASASKVFQQKFQNSEDTVDLLNISPDILSDILTYIYTGNAPNIKSKTTELLIAADRYDIQDLVTECLYKLQLKFTSKNIAETLALADQLTNGDLVKRVCTPFIKHNYVSVFQSNSWKTLKETSKSLALEIMEQVLI